MLNLIRTRASGALAAAATLLLLHLAPTAAAAVPIGSLQTWEAPWDLSSSPLPPPFFSTTVTFTFGADFDASDSLTWELQTGLGGAIVVPGGTLVGGAGSPPFTPIQIVLANDSPLGTLVFSTTAGTDFDLVGLDVFMTSAVGDTASVSLLSGLVQVPESAAGLLSLLGLGAIARVRGRVGPGSDGRA